MSTFTHRAVAGEGVTVFFDRHLAELATLVGIPPPIFQGQQLYKQSEIERWLIETTIPANPEDPSTHEEIYEERYPDWEISLSIAMQGAIGRICGIYRHLIPTGSPYRTLGRRSMDGVPFYYTMTEHWPLQRRYLMEHECGAAALEDLLKEEMKFVDQAVDVVKEANDRLETLENTVIYLDQKREELREANSRLEEKKTKLEERIKMLEEPQKMEEELLEQTSYNRVIIKTLSLTVEIRDMLFLENVELKKKLEEALAAQKKAITIQEDQEMTEVEEDPEERTIETDDGEILWIVPEKDDKPAFNTRSHPCKVICTKAIRGFRR